MCKSCHCPRELGLFARFSRSLGLDRCLRSVRSVVTPKRFVYVSRTRILKLAAIRGLGALAFLVEPFENASGSTLVTIGGRCDRIRPVTVTWLPRLS